MFPAEAVTCLNNAVDYANADVAILDAGLVRPPRAMFEETGPYPAVTFEQLQAWLHRDIQWGLAFTRYVTDVTHMECASVRASLQGFVLLWILSQAADSFHVIIVTDASMTPHLIQNYGAVRYLPDPDFGSLAITISMCRPCPVPHAMISPRAQEAVLAAAAHDVALAHV